jgi:hypothetical protein
VEKETKSLAEAKESKLMDVWGEVWMQAVKEPVLGNRAVLEQRLDWSMEHFRARANGKEIGNWNCGKKTDDEVLKVRDEWQHREVARVECFRQLVVLGWSDWSTTRWMMSTKRGANTLERMLRRKERHADSLTVGVLAGMARAASEGKVGTITGIAGELKLYSGDKAETKQMIRERKKQVVGKEWGIKVEVGVQTEKSGGGGSDSRARVQDKERVAAQPMTNTTLTEEMRHSIECRAVQLDKGREEIYFRNGTERSEQSGVQTGSKKEEITKVDQAVQVGQCERGHEVQGFNAEMRDNRAEAGTSVLVEESGAGCWRTVHGQKWRNKEQGWRQKQRRNNDWRSEARRGKKRRYGQ